MTATVFGFSVVTIVGLFIVLAVARTVIHYLRRNRPLTKYHVPAIMLLLLWVTAAFGIVLAVEAVDRELQGTEYAVVAEQPPSDSFSDSQETPPDTRETITTQAYLVSGKEMSGPYKFDELSPDAQDVFLSALRGEDSYLEKYTPRVTIFGELQKGDTYTTRSPPPEFQPGYWEADAEAPPHTFVQYDSTWYLIHVVNLEGSIAVFFVLIGSGILTGITLAAGWASITLPSFKIPVSVLVGLGGSIPVAILAQDRQSLIPGKAGWSFIGVTLVIWIILRLFERQRQQSFRERMTTTDDR